MITYQALCMYPGTLHVGAMDEMRWVVTCTESRTDVTPVVASQSWRLFLLVRAPCLLSFPTLTLRVPQDDHLQSNSHSPRVSPFALHPPSTLRYRVIACFYFSFLFSILNRLPSPPPPRTIECHHGRQWRVLHLRHRTSPPIHHPRGCSIGTMRRSNTLFGRWLSRCPPNPKVAPKGPPSSNQGYGREVLVGSHRHDRTTEIANFDALEYSTRPKITLCSVSRDRLCPRERRSRTKHLPSIASLMRIRPRAMCTSKQQNLC